MNVLHPTPAERHNYRIIAVAFTKKTDSTEEHITLLMRNLTRRTYGNQTLVLFRGSFYQEFKSSIVRCKKADESKPEAEKIVHKDADLFPKADYVISDKDALLEYFTEDRNIDDITFFDGGIVKYVFDNPMYQIWRDTNGITRNVCIGKGADGRPLMGKPTKGAKMYTSAGELKVADSYSQFVFYMSHEGNVFSPLTPEADIKRAIDSRFVPMQPTAVIADSTADTTGDNVASDDIL